MDELSLDCDTDGEPSDSNTNFSPRLSKHTRYLTMPKLQLYDKLLRSLQCLMSTFGSGGVKTMMMMCCVIAINLELNKNEHTTTITDHAEVGLNDRINKHCTQGCDCFFAEEDEMLFLCL